MTSVLQDTLARLAPEHAAALEWFVEHEGDVGPRPWRRAGKSVVPGVKMAMTAERGIHKPAELDYALSLGATKSSVYLDGRPSKVDRETWILPYKEHSGADGLGIGSPWNRALLRNMRDRIPVGVFVPAGPRHLNLGLAMPESFDAETGTFLLRGPMTHSQTTMTWGAPLTDPEMDLLDTPIVSEESTAMLGLVRRREAQGVFRDSLLEAYSGKCCVTRYDAEQALQGAHILSYSGRSSQIAQNGLLLRADVHLLFDRHLIAVDPDTLRVRVSPRLSRSGYAPLDGQEILDAACQDLAPDPVKLAVHLAVFDRAAAG